MSSTTLTNLLVKPSTKKQTMCIRQGCPLSPYLFLLVMTRVDHDVQRTCCGYVRNARIPNLDYDAVYYADDAILFSTSPRALNELILHVERFSSQYGLMFNRDKCCVLHMQAAADIHFSDQAPLPKAREAVYLRNNLNSS